MNPLIAAEEESGSFLVSPNVGLMIWTLVVFGITLYVLWKVAFPRIAEAPFGPNLHTMFSAHQMGGCPMGPDPSSALVNAPTVLLADEPTGNLDSSNTRDVLRLLRRAHDGGQAILMVTHDARVASLADRVINLFDGMVADDAKIPKGRVRRSAKLGSIVGVQGARYAGTKATNVARSEESGREKLEQRHLETAMKMVGALGQMKGAAMKLGQFASFIDTEFIPEEYREIYQEQLAKLRTDAPSMPWEKVEKVLLEEYDGEPVSELFADFEQEAFAQTMRSVRTAKTRPTAVTAAGTIRTQSALFLSAVWSRSSVKICS